MEGRLPMLERERERRALADLLDRVLVRRQGAVAVIEGLPGIGKSRLLTSALELARERGARTLFARGAELEFELAFGAVRQLFAQEVVGLPSRDRDAVLGGPAQLARAVLGLAHNPPTELGDPLYGLFWLTANLADDRPLVLAVDDLHWIDEESGRFMAYLGRRVEDLPILVLAATRPDEPGARHEPAAALATSGTVLRLGPLSEVAVAELLEATWREPASARVVADVLRATGGNPFLVGELARSLADREGAAALAAAAPSTVATAVLDRVERVSPQAGALARATALFPAGAPLRDAAAVAGLDASAAAAAADGLVAAGVFAEGERLEFLHPIMRAAVYERLGEFGRRQGHARAADVLLAREAPSEEIASHLLAGEPGGSPESVDVLRNAAATAADRGALRGAARYLERALEEPPPRAALTDLSCELGRLQAMVGDDRAEETLERAVAAATSVGERVDAALDLAAVLVGRLKPDEAVEVLLAVRALPELDRERRLLVSAMLASAAWASARFPELYAQVADELDADLRGETPGERLVLTQAAARMFDRCEPHERVSDVLLRSLGNTPAGPVALGSGDLGDPLALLIACGKLQAAEEICRARESHARATGNDGLYAATQVWLSRIAFHRGDVRGADAIARLGVEAGAPAVRTVLASVLASVCIAGGRYDEARAWLSDAHFGPPGSAWSLTRERRRGQLALAEGRPADAVAALEDSRDAFFRREAFNPAETTFLVDLASALAALGRMDEASALLRDMQGRAERFGEPRPIGLIHIALGRVLTGSDALESYERAVDVLASSPYRLDAARAHAELGAALRRRNRRVEAREHFRAALDYAQRNGVEPLARRAEEELRATGARPRRLVLTGVEALTPSEARIARLAAGGLTNRQIAQQLFLTVKTIEMHLAAAYRKLDVGSRKELPAALGVSEAA